MNERGWEGSVVPVHDEVKGRKEGEGFVLSAEDFVGDDPTPEGVECGSRKDFVSSVGPEVEIVERELNVEGLRLIFDGGNNTYFGRIPHQIDNAISERLCSNSVSSSSRTVGRAI